MTELTKLYLQYSPPGAEPLSDEAFAAQLAKQSSRRQKIVELVLRGMSHREIGAEVGGVSGGTVRKALIETMLAIRKAALGLPRYHNEGRPRGRSYGKRKPSPATTAQSVIHSYKARVPAAKWDEFARQAKVSAKMFIAGQITEHAFRNDLSLTMERMKVARVERG